MGSMEIINRRVGYLKNEFDKLSESFREHDKRLVVLENNINLLFNKRK